MPDGIDEIFTIRLLAHPVNAENEVELRRPSHKCYFRAARRRRQGRSPKGRAMRELFRRRALNDADNVMANVDEYGDGTSVEIAVKFHERFATGTQRKTHSHRCANHSSF
jgi:hypothetical protein